MTAARTTTTTAAASAGTIAAAGAGAGAAAAAATFLLYRIYVTSVLLSVHFSLFLYPIT
jgi:hypothetical protein